MNSGAVAPKGDGKMVEYKLKNGNILKDGHTMFLQDVVSDLKRKAYLEDLKSKTDGGATVLCSDGLCNISLKKGEDGHWLSVKASNGKQASICIENMNYGPIVKQALVQWAKDQFADVA